MPTVVIRITEPNRKGGGFPVQLLWADGDDPGALAPVKGARAVIPPGLEPEQPVLEHMGGPPLTVERVQELYENAGEVSDVFAAIGEFLYRLVARGKVGAALARACDEAADAVRTMLDIAPADALRELRRLPWELMWDGKGTPFFLDRQHAMLRGEPRTAEEPNPIVRVAAGHQVFPLDDWPLRVLVIFGADRDFAEGVGGIGASQELRWLETLFARERCEVELEVLEHPTRDGVIQACRDVRPHILHFIGHGEAGSDPRDHKLQIWSGGDDAEGEYVPWSLFDMRIDLQDVWPRFAFLNACVSANAAEAQPPGVSALPFSSIADAFLNLGALGVLGMQGNVPGDLAAEFSRAFYQEIVAGAPVDLAVGEARRVMSRKRPNYVRRREWSFPVLRTRVMPQLVLPRRPPVPCPTQMVKRFVSRVPQRRVVRETVRGAAAPGGGTRIQGSPHLLLLAGDPDVGKSHLAKWCTQTCARFGMRAAYVSLGEQGAFDLLDVLRWIRDGQQPPVDGAPTERDPEWPLPAGAFRRFTWDLNHQLRGATTVPDLPEGIDEIVDEGVRLTAAVKPAETFIDDTLAQFCRALEAAAPPEGLVLVLDQIERVSDTALAEWLPRGLFRPVALGGVRGVRLILVARSGDAKVRAALDSVSITPTPVAMDFFKPEEYDRLARQLCFQWSPETYDTLKEAVAAVHRKFGESDRWNARLLWRVEQICQAFT